MTHRIRVVDVFTEKPLAGNQLAVVLDGRGLSTDLMQRIAIEMNLAETTFILPPDDPAHAARVRIFTPAREMPFAGHPTIGTAWVLVDEGLVPDGKLDFKLEEQVGPIGVRGVKEDGRLVFWMTHPQVTFGDVFEDRARVAAALGLTEESLNPDVPIQMASTGLPFLYVPMRRNHDVDAATSDSQKLHELFVGRDEIAVFPFSVQDPGRLYSRMFAGHVFDIREDPATGSASGPLGAFVVKYGLVPRAPRVSLVSEQGTKMGRPSFIHIELTYGHSKDIPERIEVGGAVMPVLSGSLSDFD